MKQSTRRLLFWSPRVLTILFALFLSLFALDVFSEGYGPWETVLALVIHLIPTFVVLLVLAISWRWEWVGAVLFVALGLFYLVMFWDEFDLPAFLMISGPLFLVGVLFLINWLRRRELRSGTSPSTD